MTALPWMGLGLSTNLGPRDPPDPYRLLAERPGLFEFVEYSAPLSIAEARALPGRFETLLARREEIPVVFHPVQLNLWGPEPETEEAISFLAEHCAEVGTPWVGNDVAWWHHRGQVFPGYLYLPPPLDEAALAECAAHAAAIAKRLPVPLLLENPTILARRGTLHVLDFMAGIAERAGVDLILDVGHLWAYQLASDLPVDAGFERFPFERVVEIHVAGGVVARHGERRFYLDDHPQPVRDEVFALLEAVLPRCPRLRALTFEGDGHGQGPTTRTLERLRSLVPREPGGEVAAAKPLPPHAAPGGERAWALYDETFGVEVGAEDPVGLGVERSFRHAVLAERLDRIYPLSRLLLASKPETLAAFSSSAEFRDLFDGTARQLRDAFGAWGRRRLRETPHPAAEVALAFETWAHGLAAREAPVPAPGGVRLSAGVAIGIFPVDLAEALAAAASLRRHLVGRAWATGTLDLEGLESLAQTVVRAPRRPSPVAVRLGTRLDVIPLDPPLAAVLKEAARGEPWERFAVRPDLDPEAIERAAAARLIVPG